MTWTNKFASIGKQNFSLGELKFCFISYGQKLTTQNKCTIPLKMFQDKSLAVIF